MSHQNQLDALFRQDPVAKRYFEALPPVAQETIRMSGINFTTCQDLMKCAEQFLQKG